MNLPSNQLSENLTFLLEVKTTLFLDQFGEQGESSQTISRYANTWDGCCSNSSALSATLIQHHCRKNKCTRLHPEAVTFSDVPRNAAEKHLAGVQRIFVVPGRQLTAPGERGLVHSWTSPEKKSRQKLRFQWLKPLLNHNGNTELHDTTDLERATYLRPVCAGGPPSQCWTHRPTGRARRHQAMESQCASGEKRWRRGWRWMAGSRESWSPAGPVASPVAWDPSAYLMRDKAAEAKSAKSTAERKCPDVTGGLTLPIWHPLCQCWAHQGLKKAVWTKSLAPECSHVPGSRFCTTETRLIQQWSETWQPVWVSTWPTPHCNLKLTLQSRSQNGHCRPAATPLSFKPVLAPDAAVCTSQSPPVSRAFYC